MKKILALLLIPIAFVSCKLPSSATPDEDSCNSGRATTSTEFITLNAQNKNIYVKTTKPVDINCHGNFKCYVSYGDSQKFNKEAPFPPVQINFGVDFILGAPFPMDTVKHEDFLDEDGKPIYTWELTASQGAKNLNDAQEWHYDFSAYLEDTTKAVRVGMSIDYKPKNQ